MLSDNVRGLNKESTILGIGKMQGYLDAIQFRTDELQKYIDEYNSI